MTLMVFVVQSTPNSYYPDALLVYPRPFLHALFPEESNASIDISTADYTQRAVSSVTNAPSATPVPTLLLSRLRESLPRRRPNSTSERCAYIANKSSFRHILIGVYLSCEFGLWDNSALHTSTRRRLKCVARRSG